MSDLSPYIQDPTGDVHLQSPTTLPEASGYLWNKRMMIQMTCRGFATAQFMQPEPAKYSRGPALEATSFMQPEHPYYAHHPGRFFYVRDNATAELFSAPYEPVRAPLDEFRFTCKKHMLTWLVERSGVRVELELTLTRDDVCELWRATISNINGSEKKLSFFPSFSIGYMSWMNQSALYDDELGAVIANSITPYQKVEDYFKNTELADKTYLVCSEKPDAWLANQKAFEGEGGLHAPDALKRPKLSCLGSDYEMPAAVMQFDLELAPGESKELLFAFGPAKSKRTIERVKKAYLSNSQSFTQAQADYASYIKAGNGVLTVATDDPDFDHFVNHWLPRQVYYHGDANRLTTDPQTRNFLQDLMGMAYIKPDVARANFLLALSQQNYKGDMPDGVLLRPDATLKYINQVPHADHNVWLTVCLKAYLDETGDYSLLGEEVAYKDHTLSHTLVKHINRAMDWLLTNRDDRGLSFIHQGDWCDPMNMVGYKGKGVSAWLTMATSYALQIWADILDQIEHSESASYFREAAEGLNVCINRHFWDGHWYARGITDAGSAFGVSQDDEGKIFLNAQSWAILCGAADEGKITQIYQSVEEHLDTPFGPSMLAPAYTAMREDVGRVTQKFPGSAENGSVYNHAAVFFAYSLFKTGTADKAFKVLKKMLPQPDDAGIRGQLPVYIPNYYRGAYHQFPRTAGKSSQLFNTGTVGWYYRTVIEELFGVCGTADGLRFEPNLPLHWHEAKVTRQFRGATFEVTYSRKQSSEKPMEIEVNGTCLMDNTIRKIDAGEFYQVQIYLPDTNQQKAELKHVS